MVDLFRLKAFLSWRYRLLASVPWFQAKGSGLKASICGTWLKGFKMKGFSYWLPLLGLGLAGG